MISGRRIRPGAMSFLLTRDLAPGVWWTGYPAEEKTLTGWVGGPRSAELLRLSVEELQESALRAAANALRLGEDVVRAELQGIYTYDRQRDQSFRGAYSWAPMGGLGASSLMSEPIEDVLFFVGEHTNTTGHWGRFLRL